MALGFMAHMEKKTLSLGEGCTKSALKTNSRRHHHRTDNCLSIQGDPKGSSSQGVALSRGHGQRGHGVAKGRLPERALVAVGDGKDAVARAAHRLP